MPGSDQPIVSGFNNTYARVRVLSAMSALWSPVYNYDPGRGEVRHLGSFIGKLTPACLNRVEGMEFSRPTLSLRVFFFL